MPHTPGVAPATHGTAVRVVITDDNALIRAGLRSLLATDTAWDVVGVAANGPEALELCRLTQPDLVLVDLHMPVMDGLSVSRAIKSEWPAMRVIVMTADGGEPAARAANASGADGFVVKVPDAFEFLTKLQDLERPQR